MKQITKNDVVHYVVTSNFSPTEEYEYTIDWDDGAIDVYLGGTPFYFSHVYSTRGKFLPTIRILDTIKGCWKTVSLDTIWVYGCEISATSTQVPTTSPDPGLVLNVDGLYDIEAGNEVKLEYKWYLGDGNTTAANNWSNLTTIPSHDYDIPLSFPSGAYTEDGFYTAWAVVRLSGSAQPNLYHKEISNKIPIEVYTGSPSPPQGTLELTWNGLFVQECNTTFNCTISGDAPFGIAANWGDGTSDIYSNVPADTLYALNHVYPSVGGTTTYTATFFVTNSLGLVKSYNYTVTISPTLELIVSHPGSCFLYADDPQLAVVRGGKGPYTIHMESIVQSSNETQLEPKLKLEVIQDGSVTKQYFPGETTYYGPGSYKGVLNNVTGNFTLSVDHNMGTSSFDSFAVRVWVVDANNKKSKKVTMTRCGVDNIRNVNTEGV